MEKMTLNRKGENLFIKLIQLPKKGRQVELLNKIKNRNHHIIQ